MKRIYFLIIFIIFLVPKVYCADINISNIIKYPYNGSNGSYQGTEIYNSGTANLYNVGTRYNGQLSRIRFYTDYSFSSGVTYTITLNMATNDWRNKFMGPQVYRANLDGSLPSTGLTNWASNSSISFVSMKKIKFNFTPGDTLGPLTYFNIYSWNITSTAFTGETNWNLSSIIISDPTISSGGNGGSSATPTPTPTSTPNSTPNNQAIIDSANQNTQDIINNNNNNTQDIIDNANNLNNDLIENSNSNTQSIIDNNNSNASCPIGPHVFNSEEFKSVNGKYLNANGEETSNSNYNISPYLIIKPSSHYDVIMSTSSTSVYYCIYKGDKTIISCAQQTGGELEFITPTSGQYIRFSLGKGFTLQVKGAICNNWEKEGLSNVVDSVNNGIGVVSNAINGSTNSIIDSANQNTQDLISNASCPIGPLEMTMDEWALEKKKMLNVNGEEISNNSYGISPYLIIKPSTSYTFTLSSTSNNAHYCIYKGNKTIISCASYSSRNIIITTPSNAQYIRFSLGGGIVLSIKGPVCNDWEKEATNRLNDAMTDDNIDDKTGFFTNFDNDTHGLTGIITLPLSTIESLTTTSCVSLSIPIPYTNSNISLPCMSEVYNDYIPDVYNIWKVVSFGIISYFICLDIFKMVKGFKDPNEDKVEVLDL